MTVPETTNGHVVRNVCIVGGAGFIGSHFVARLLGDQATETVTVYDNFSSGRAWHLQPFEGDARLRVVKADVEDLANLASAVHGHETIIHLASNPDIARALKEEEAAVMKDLQQALGRAVTIKPDVHLHHEQFDVMAT